MTKTQSISFNMSLGNAVYALTRATANDSIPCPAVEPAHRDTPEQQKPVLHVQLHWGRKAELDEALCDFIDKRVAEIFDEIGASHALEDIVVVDLIDCGDIAMNPLSGFGVINYLLEVIAEYVSGDCKCRVFSANYDDIGLAGGQSLVFDTASEEFRDYLMAFIKASLSEINQRSGADLLLRDRSGRGSGPRVIRH